MATVSLQADQRDAFGKGAARKIRAAGRIPAVLYRAGQQPVHISLDPNELELSFKRTGNRNTLVDIGVGGGNHLCLVREVQRHPVSQLLEHVDFYEVATEEEVDVKVKVTTVGTAPGESLGGKVQIMRRDLQLRCRPADIPDALAVDVSELNVGDIIKAGDITLPKDSTLLTDVNMNVVTVTAKRVVAEVVEEDDEESAVDEEED